MTHNIYVNGIWNTRHTRHTRYGIRLYLCGFRQWKAGEKGYSSPGEVSIFESTAHLGPYLDPYLDPKEPSPPLFFSRLAKQILEYLVNAQLCEINIGYYVKAHLFECKS